MVCFLLVAVATQAAMNPAISFLGKFCMVVLSHALVLTSLLFEHFSEALETDTNKRRTD